MGLRKGEVCWIRLVGESGWGSAAWVRSSVVKHMCRQMAVKRRNVVREAGMISGVSGRFRARWKST
jgi:hypothetical protein